MKKSKLRLICLCLALALVFSCMAACGGGNGGGSSSGSGDSTATEAPAAENESKPATVHRLNFSIGDPATSSKAIYYQSLADKTLEATNGGLEITIHSGGTLFGHLEVREGVLSGAADIGWFCTPFAPGQYPLSEALQLPLEYGNQMALTYAYLELYKKSPELQAELDEVKVLGLYAGPVNLIFTKEPITTPDDLRGLQIRTMSGVPSDCLTAWGASPAFMGAGEIYEAMDKGVVQGFTFDWSGIQSNTLYEVFNYQSSLPFYVNPFIIMMNKTSYDNIPAEYKAAFDEIWASEEASYNYAQIFADESEASRDLAIKDYGIEIIEADTAAFKEYADEYIANWIETKTTGSFDAAAYIELVRELYAEGEAKYPES